ncbi:hypothetical protein [Streptomyces sp. NPDC002588]|uniref:hypothetical protein n=1 Tax=Streptomyces sp. NPDC002588 TaxID=3154419 RepID=UPI0033230280
MTVTVSAQNNKASKGTKILIGGVAAALVMVLGGGGAYWWHEHNKLSQASMADCQLAQKIVDEAQNPPSDKAALEKWYKNAQQRRSRIGDGYLAANVSNYDGWAYLNAKGEGNPPSKDDVKKLEDTADRHCIEAGIDISLPAIAS